MTLKAQDKAQDKAQGEFVFMTESCLTRFAISFMYFLSEREVGGALWGIRVGRAVWNALWDIRGRKSGMECMVWVRLWLDRYSSDGRLWPGGVVAMEVHVYHRQDLNITR
jgi:hypothetical protein